MRCYSGNCQIAQMLTLIVADWCCLLCYDYICPEGGGEQARRQTDRQTQNNLCKESTKMCPWPITSPDLHQGTRHQHQKIKVLLFAYLQHPLRTSRLQAAPRGHAKSGGVGSEMADVVQFHQLQHTFIAALSGCPVPSVSVFSTGVNI